MKHIKNYLLILSLLVFGFNLNAKESINLDSDWKFTLNSGIKAEQINLDDRNWDNIRIPHTWNALDGQDGGDNYYRGVGLYRKNVLIPSYLSGKTVYLKIGAANTTATVYINNKLVGTHTGGYSAFMFDITNKVFFGKNNIITIKVDNSSTIICPPLSADFTFFGGITRNVELLVANPVHLNCNETISNALTMGAIQVAQSGVIVKQSKVSKTSANLSIVTKLRNASSTPAQATVIIKLINADGKVVKELTDDKKIPASDTLSSTINTSVANPHLWDGVNDPYLYKVDVTVKVKGKTTDNSIQPLGFRYFSVDANNGFFLNGKSYPLRGICLHEEKKDKGRAVSNADRKEALDLLLETGANYLRLSHYQHGDFTYNYLDSLGIICWAEIPTINSVGANAEENVVFRKNAVSMMYDLIRQQYNHPSIVFWGLCNEIDYKTGVSVTETVEQLNQVVKSEDTYRLTTLAAMFAERVANWIPDTYANNRYDGWYYNSIADFGTSMDELHLKYPTKKIGVSEYGVGANIAQHEYPAVKPNEGGQYHPEEYQNLFHEEYLKMINARPYLWATSMWVGIDFTSDRRDEGMQPGINDKGLITFDRAVKKDAFYWYKANWNKKDAVVYISSRRYTNRNSISNTVKIYSNCPTVTLKLNGAVIGTKSSNDHIFQWDNVTMLEGDNKIEAMGTFNGTVYVDNVSWDCTNSIAQ